MMESINILALLFLFCTAICLIGDLCGLLLDLAINRVKNKNRVRGMVGLDYVLASERKKNFNIK
jgi:hypothetical protein